LEVEEQARIALGGVVHRRLQPGEDAVQFALRISSMQEFIAWAYNVVQIPRNYIMAMEEEKPDGR
jgi:hypothetical protein